MVKFHQGKNSNNGDQEQEVKRRSIINEQGQRWKNTKSADESFQAGPLSTENLFMRLTEASFTLLIIDD